MPRSRSVSALGSALIVGCALVAGTAARAHAQDARAQAHDESVSAVGAFEHGDYQLALAHFRAAFELAPVVELRFNIALCLERLGRFREAIATYEAALADGTLGAEGRARADERLADVRSRVGRISFVGDAGMHAGIDAERACDVPCELTVDPGTYAWTATAGERSATGSVVVRPGASERVEVHAAAITPPRDAPPPRDTPPPSHGWSPGWLFWTGLAVTVAGAGGVLGFGLWSNALLADYERAPTASLADDGTLVTLAANLCIGLAAAGAIAILIDVLTGGVH